MDWSFENGWLIITFILSVFANIVGIPFAILKTIDIIKKWRNEKTEKESKEIVIKFLDLKGIVSHSKTGTPPNQVRISTVKLNFDIRNLGNENTTVKIFDAKFKVRASDNNKYIAQTRSRSNTDLNLSKEPFKIDINANDKITTHLTFRLTDNESYFQEAKVRFKYEFLNLNRDYINNETDWMIVNLLFKS